MNIQSSLLSFLPILFFIGCGVNSPNSVTHLDAAAAAELLKNQPELTVVDVRTPGEFTSGSIKGARNLDIQSASFVSQVKELDPKAPYLIY